MKPQRHGPIFIIGAPRSGTSMLHWALVQHPNLWGSEETDYLTKLVPAIHEAYAFGSRFGEHHWIEQQRVSKTEFMETIGNGVNKLYSSRSNGIRWIDQTPSYALICEDLSIMFPNAIFVHIYRDGRQCVHSMQAKLGLSFWKALRIWRTHVMAGLQASQRIPGRVLQLQFETVVRSPKDALQQVFDFIGETYEPRSLDFLRTPINTLPGKEAESPTDKLNPRWKDWNVVKRLLFHHVNGDILAQMGYT